MFSSLTTKIALKKLGLNSDTFNFTPTTTDPDPPPKSKKLTKSAPPGTVPGLDDRDDASTSPTKWPAWMTVRALPLTVQPWLAPPPPPIPVAAECPRAGDLAPLDRDRKLTFGGGKKVLVVFLRCVGCAFAQKTFLALRALATKHANTLTCIAVSHSSPAATRKWLDLVGGAWNVAVVVDEDRAVYAAWGLGTGGVWSVLSPAAQAAAWRERDGWLAATVAGAISRTGLGGPGKSVVDVEREERERELLADRRRGRLASVGAAGVVGRDGAPEEAGGPVTVMGNKWQQAGAWAVDGRGTVVWGRKAARADDVLDLEAGVRALGL